MAYDRYDRGRDRGRPDDDRGFFERAGDEISSWFGDDESERGRRDSERMNARGGDHDRDRYNYGGWGEERSSNRDREFGRDRPEHRSYEPMDWTSSERDYRSSRPRTARHYDRLGYAGYDRDVSSRGTLGGTDPDYMSPTGPSYGYAGTFGSGNDRGYGSGGYGRSYERSESPWGRDDYRNTSYAGSTRDNDRHYRSWRQRQLNELDRDYDQYCRERQERFESDFGSWRDQRLNKRQQLGSIREHMDVVGSDGKTIGKVDCVKGDHIVLTKSDSPDNRHHAIDCSMIQTVEGDQVRLDMPAEEAKSRWEDAEKRGFFGRNRDEQEKTNLNRSFSGTYES